MRNGFKYIFTIYNYTNINKNTKIDENNQHFNINICKKVTEK